MDPKPHRLYVGTIDEGLWRSTDGETLRRTSDGMFVECHVRALAFHPQHDRTLYIGSELGLFRSLDGADNWNQIDSPLNGLQIWSILLSPATPDVILVGTCPSRIFRSADGGKSWTEARVRIRPDCPRIIHTRVTSFCAHPDDPRTFWAGVEIDGVYRSRDAGQSWESVGKGLSSVDIHSLTYAPGGRLIATTNNDVNVSLDEGETWQPLKLHQTLPLPYFRGLAQRPDWPESLLLGNGDAPPGTTGLVARSNDCGVQLAMRANAFSREQHDLELCGSSRRSRVDLCQQRQRTGLSLDRRRPSWTKLAREFGEIRALAWTP